MRRNLLVQISTTLVAALVVGVITPSHAVVTKAETEAPTATSEVSSTATPSPAPESTDSTTATDSTDKDTSAASTEKPYGDSLKLNNNIKLGKKKTYTKTGYVKEHTLFKKKKNIKIKYTIKTTRKSSGDNYKVTYKVNYKFLNNPKINAKKISYDDWWWGLTQPDPIYTVFDYQSGKSFEVKNSLGVKVKHSKFKYTYYPKQKFTYPFNKKAKPWFRNYKKISYSFTVTYPKTLKDVCVGIGFVNMVDESSLDGSTENKYWNGKTVYGKTKYYKKGKKTMSYMRLNQ